MEKRHFSVQSLLYNNDHDIHDHLLATSHSHVPNFGEKLGFSGDYNQHNLRLCRSSQLLRHDPLTGLDPWFISLKKDQLPTFNHHSNMDRTVVPIDSLSQPNHYHDFCLSKRAFSYSFQTVTLSPPYRPSLDNATNEFEDPCEGCPNPDARSRYASRRLSGGHSLSRSAPVSSVQSGSDDDSPDAFNRGNKRWKCLRHISAWKNNYRSFTENTNNTNNTNNSNNGDAISSKHVINYDIYRSLLQEKGAIQSRQTSTQSNKASSQSDDFRRKAEEEATVALCERRLFEYLQRSLSLAKKRASRMTLRLHERLKAQEILNSPDDTRVITAKFNMEITPRILSCLAPMVWLNDEVINFYMNLLQERNEKHVAKEEPVPKAYFWSTFFYTKLTGEDETGTRQNYSFKNVSRWTKRKKIDLFSYDLIFVPVHLRKIHWTLGVVDLKNRRVFFFDSMNGYTGTEFYVNVMQYLRDEYSDKKGEDLPKQDEWIFDEEETHPHVPQQSNGSDCGVFVCQFCECLSDGRPLDFSQDDIPNTRLKMICQIAEGEIK